MPNINHDISKDAFVQKYNSDINNIQSNHIAWKIKEYLDSNITSFFTLESIAKKFGISRSYLSHTFKKSFNISVLQYIKHKKLNLAIEYCNSGMRLSIAAEKAGFEDYRAFYLAYRKKFGISPSQTLKIK